MKRFNIALTFLILGLTAQTFAQQNLPPLIKATGKGEVRVAPDRAEIRVGVSLRNENLEELSETTDSRSSAIIAYLRDEGVLSLTSRPLL